MSIDENSPVPRDMSEEEVEQAIQDPANAARKATEAGFDGVEIHGKVIGDTAAVAFRFD